MCERAGCERCVRVCSGTLVCSARVCVAAAGTGEWLGGGVGCVLL